MTTTSGKMVFRLQFVLEKRAEIEPMLKRETARGAPFQ